MKDRYEQISEVDTIVEKSEDVEKFNPWHDARGRFTTAGGGGGRGSFSANPKTKAGRMAIARQVQTNRSTFNRHKESKGENVWQNHHWIQSGKFPGRRKPPGYKGQTSNGGLTTANGLNFGRNQSTSKPAANKPKTSSKPAASKPKQTNQSAAGAKTPSTSHKMVTGKDVRYRVNASNMNAPQAMDMVARMQGFKGQGRVVKNRTEFQDAVKKSGIVMYRTVGDGTDVVTGKQTKAQKFIDYLKKGTEDQLSLNGFGASAYGQGAYTASTKARPGTIPSKKDQERTARESIRYKPTGTGKTIAMTLDPSAKVADYDTIYTEFKNLSSREKRKYGYDEGVYAAAKGYDAMTKRVYGNTNYTMVYNRTKLVFFDETYDNMMPSDLGFNDTRMPVGTF